MKYVKLIKIVGNRFDIRTDNVPNLQDLWKNRSNIFNYILLISVGSDRYYIDLGRLVVDYPELLLSSDIRELIDQLSPQMVYSYQTDLFNTNRLISSYSDGAIPGEVVVSPYNYTADEEAATTYSPSFRDLVIRCTDFELDKVFPVVNSKLCRCEWVNGKIVLRGEVELARSLTSLYFVSLANCNFEVKSVRELEAEDNQVPTGRVPILVLGGTLHYGSPWVYRFFHHNRKVQLNMNFLQSEKSFHGYETIDDWLDDTNSYWILVEATNIFIRGLPLIPVSASFNKVFSYREEDSWKSHSDYICIDWVRHKVLPTTVIDDRYKNLIRMDDPTERHVYIDSPESLETVELIQLAVC